MVLSSAIPTINVPESMANETMSREKVSALSENDVEFVPGGVRLTLIKRVRRRSHRSFKDSSPWEIADVVETEEFKDRPR